MDLSFCCLWKRRDHSIDPAFSRSRFCISHAYKSQNDHGNGSSPRNDQSGSNTVYKQCHCTLCRAYTISQKRLDIKDLLDSFVIQDCCQITHGLYSPVTQKDSDQDVHCRTGSAPSCMDPFVLNSCKPCGSKSARYEKSHKRGCYCDRQKDRKSHPPGN